MDCISEGADLKISLSSFSSDCPSWSPRLLVDTKQRDHEIFGLLRTAAGLSCDAVKHPSKEQSQHDFGDIVQACSRAEVGRRYYLVTRKTSALIRCFSELAHTCQRLMDVYDAPGHCPKMCCW